MHNTEYNTYQQYQRSPAMKKIFSVLRTDHVALLNIISKDNWSIHQPKNILQKKVANMRTDERLKLNRVYMKEIQMRKGNRPWVR